MKDRHPIDEIFKKLEKTSQKSFPNQDGLWSKIDAQLEEAETPRVSQTFYKKWAIAASFVLVGVLVWALWSQFENSSVNNEEMAQSENVTEMKNEAVVILDDEELTEAESTKTEYADLLDSESAEEVYAIEENYGNKTNMPYANKPLIYKDSVVESIDNFKITTPSKVRSRTSPVQKEELDELKVSNDANEKNAENKDKEDSYGYMDVAEVSPKELSKRKSSMQSDFYFIDGRQVSKTELEEIKADDMESVVYLSHNEAVKKGYINFYTNGDSKKGKVIEMVYWDKINAKSLSKRDIKATLEQLKKVDTSNFSKEQKEKLNSIIKTIENRKP